jgi:dienelactone hydrolase
MRTPRFAVRIIVLTLLVLVLLLGQTGANAQDRFMAALPPDSALTISRDVEYAKSGERSLKFDLYRSRDAQGAPPVVVFFNGVGGEWLRGHVQYTSWPRYVTTAGFAGVSMDSTEGSAPADFDRLVTYLGEHGGELGIDPKQIVVWACSANVRSGLPLVMDPGRRAIVGAVMYYGTAEPVAFRLDLPILFVRAGTDNPGLNRGLDRLVNAGLAANAPVTVLSHPAGRHGFDLRDDTDETRAVLAQTLEFMKGTVDAAVRRSRTATATVAEAAAALFSENYAAAAAAYRRLAAEKPSDPEVHQRLGEALAAQDDFKAAIPALERSLELGTPNRGIVSFALVRAHARTGQIDGAFLWLEKMKPWMRFFREQLLESADLAPLRADPRFRQIVGSN